MNYENFRVELRRHIGIMQHDTLGIVSHEWPQKLVLVYPPDLGGQCRQMGILGDDPIAKVSFFPDVIDNAPPKLVEWVKAEAYRLRDAGEFVDPPEPKKASGA